TRPAPCMRAGEPALHVVGDRLRGLIEERVLGRVEIVAGCGRAELRLQPRVGIVDKAAAVRTARKQIARERTDLSLIWIAGRRVGGERIERTRLGRAQRRG